VAIPLLSLALCLIDRDRRVQNWLVTKAGFATAATVGTLAILTLELFGQIDAKIPFVYFQF